MHITHLSLAICKVTTTEHVMLCGTSGRNVPVVGGCVQLFIMEI